MGDGFGLTLIREIRYAIHIESRELVEEEEVKVAQWPGVGREKATRQHWAGHGQC